jgi:hypothetical protein
MSRFHDSPVPGAHPVLHANLFAWPIEAVTGLIHALTGH